MFACVAWSRIEISEKVTSMILFNPGCLDDMCTTIPSVPALCKIDIIYIVILYWPFFWQLPLDSNIRGAGWLRDDINLGLRSLSYECDIWRSGEIPLKSGSRCPCHGFDHPVNKWLVWPFLGILFRL